MSDSLQWYCPNPVHKDLTVIRKDSFRCTDLGTQLKPIINDWMTNDESRRCKECGEVAAPKESGYASKESSELAESLNRSSNVVEAHREMPTKVAAATAPVEPKTTIETPAVVEQPEPIAPVATTPAPVVAAAPVEKAPVASTQPAAPRKKGGFFAMCCGNKGHESA